MSNTTFFSRYIRTKKEQFPFGSYLARNVIGRCHRRLHTDTYACMQISRGRPTPVPEISVQSARNSYNITAGWDVSSLPSPRPTVCANGVGVEGCCRVSKENRDWTNFPLSATRMIMRMPFGTFWIRFRERCRATRDKEEAKRVSRVDETEASLESVCGWYSKWLVG